MSAAIGLLRIHLVLLVSVVFVFPVVVLIVVVVCNSWQLGAHTVVRYSVFYMTPVSSLSAFVCFRVFFVRYFLSTIFSLRIFTTLRDLLIVVQVELFGAHLP